MLLCVTPHALMSSALGVRLIAVRAKALQWHVLCSGLTWGVRTAKRRLTSFRNSSLSVRAVFSAEWCGCASCVSAGAFRVSVGHCMVAVCLSVCLLCAVPPLCWSSGRVLQCCWDSPHRLDGNVVCAWQVTAAEGSERRECDHVPVGYGTFLSSSDGRALHRGRYFIELGCHPIFVVWLRCPQMTSIGEIASSSSVVHFAWVAYALCCESPPVPSCGLSSVRFIAVRANA
mmetsp:Transcript_24468/g.70620  ORF Transcript_24468/g.70620 Transcript_24468/m.70620 type:complete len:230 (+) Transcript_24468:2-691(+)